jgi:ring-1,2-phenylacetyl-CoA epoxidase subunit PaaD
VTAASTDRLSRALAAAAAVRDPELPDVTIAELGVLRDVRERAGEITVTVTPTFSGCPAMTSILADLDRALAGAGVAPYRIETALRPTWRSAWITAAGRDKLRAAGIAPPPERTVRTATVDIAIGPRPVEVACPRCGAAATRLLSEYAATPCRSLRRCDSCSEAFDAVKAV